MDQMCSLPNHFLHPIHPLVPKNYAAGTVYLCDGCNMPGLHKGYCCNSCNFNMHEYCRTCPTTLNSFMHPPHRLSLLTRNTSRTLRSCNVCHDQVRGLIYRCDHCNFVVHPICTRLPEYVRHVRDPHHFLRLQDSSPGWCAVCRESCTSWRYSCELCGIHIHIQCVAVSTVPPTLTQRAVPPAPQSRSLSWPSAYGGYGTHHGVSYGLQPPRGGFHHAHTTPYNTQNYVYPPPPQSWSLSWPSTYGGYGTHHGVSYGLQPPHGGFHHAYTTPYSTQNYVYPPPQGGAASSSGGIGKMMAALVMNLGIGVLSDVIFGVAGVDFSSIF